MATQTYLQLCQKVASDSGTFAEGYPATVAGQTGRLAKIVRWVREAYREIQMSQELWLFLEGAFSGPTIASQRDYAGSDFGVNERFAKFLCRGVNDDRYTIYNSDGVSDESRLIFRDWPYFRATYMIGAQTNNRPKYFTIHPSGKLYLHPIPDAVYTVKGPYLKDPQELEANDDVPEMPGRFHDLIAELALEKLGAHDESPQISIWNLRRMSLYQLLCNDQLPRFGAPEPFA